MTVIVAYDVKEDNRRARIAAVLSAYGFRLQKSVFECQLDAETRPEVLAKLSQILDLEQDVLQVFPVCGACHQGRSDFGQARTDVDVLFWIA